jgi:hypothetical protein
MTGKDLERWHELSMMAIREKDPQKFANIIEEINELLTEKVLRLGPEEALESAYKEVCGALDKKLIPLASQSLSGRPAKNKRKQTMPGIATAVKRD